MQHIEKTTATSGSARPQRTRKTARSWGDINVTLNRLVREGVIASFRTNLSSPDRTSGVNVMITPNPANNPDGAQARVSEELEALVEGVTVTVEQQQAA